MEIPKPVLQCSLILAKGIYLKKVVKTINQENKTESNFVIKNAYMVNIYKIKPLLNLVPQSATTES